MKSIRFTVPEPSPTPLLQGQFRWIRIQLDTPNTEIELRSFRVQHVQDSTPFRGSFVCDNPDLNRLWEASAYTAQIGAIPCSHTWDTVQNRLALRKLTKGHDAGILRRGESWSDYDVRFTCALYHNPNFPTGIGWMVRAADRDHRYVCRLMKSGSLQIENRSGTKSTVLATATIEPVEYESPLQITTSVRTDSIQIRINDNTVLTAADTTYPTGTIGFSMEDEHRAMVDVVTVTTPHGDILFEDTFSTGLDSWGFDRSPYFLSDGAYRDRLPWVGDLYWGGRNVYYTTGENICMKETLDIHRIHQTPEGFVWGTAYPEDTQVPESSDYGYWPSDEYSLWYAPVVADYLLFTGDTGHATPGKLTGSNRRSWTSSGMRKRDIFTPGRKTATSSTSPMPWLWPSALSTQIRPRESLPFCPNIKPQKNLWARQPPDSISMDTTSRHQIFLSVKTRHGQAYSMTGVEFREPYGNPVFIRRPNLRAQDTATCRTRTTQQRISSQRPFWVSHPQHRDSVNLQSSRTQPVAAQQKGVYRLRAEASLLSGRSTGNRVPSDSHWIHRLTQQPQSACLYPVLKQYP